MVLAAPRRHGVRLLKKTAALGNENIDWSNSHLLQH
jgi:hypothetical protein